jgi:hypothetical protein
MLIAHNLIRLGNLLKSVMEEASTACRQQVLCPKESNNKALQTSQRFRNRVVCGIDRRRFAFMSQKSAHGCGELARGLVVLQTFNAS